MTKSPDAFRTIREVADWLGVAAHVLRFWESKFSQIKPVKRAGGRRYYRPADMELVGGIKVLLHDRGMTVRGVQKILRTEGIAAVTALSPPLDRVEAARELVEGIADPAETAEETAWREDAARDDSTTPPPEEASPVVAAASDASAPPTSVSDSVDARDTEASPIDETATPEPGPEDAPMSMADLRPGDDADAPSTPDSRQEVADAPHEETHVTGMRNEDAPAPEPAAKPPEPPADAASAPSAEPVPGSDADTTPRAAGEDLLETAVPVATSEVLERLAALDPAVLAKADHATVADAVSALRAAAVRLRTPPDARMR